MLKNNVFQEKMKKYKKINIYPRNNHFRTKENISPSNKKPNLRIKQNLNQLLLENSNYNYHPQKNNSFMNYINSKTSLNPYYNNITKNTMGTNYNYLQRNRSSNNIFNKKNYYLNRHQKVLEELNIMKKNNNVMNINNNMNNNINNNINSDMNINYQLQKNYKSKSISGTAITSKKNLYDKIISRNLLINNDNKSFNTENNELNKKMDNLNNTLLYEQKLSKPKNKIKYDMEKKKMKEIINIERAKKLKGISAGRINFKSNTKKGEVIKSKLNKIKLSINKKIKSTPKQNVILRTCENRIKNKYKLFIDQTYFPNNSKNNIELFFNYSNTINPSDLGKAINYNNYSGDYSKINHRNKKIKNNVDLIIKEKYLNTNIEPEINLNINTLNFYNEQDNRIHNWIFKEKKSKDFKKGLNDELFFEEKTNNKDFQNYKLSNKYFNNDTLFNDRRPFKSINLGKYFDLELSRFNNKLNNFNHVKKAKNVINSRHIFKPIY